jgi:hypothetical protein
VRGGIRDEAAVVERKCRGRGTVNLADEDAAGESLLVVTLGKASESGRVLDGCETNAIGVGGEHLLAFLLESKVGM